MVQLLKPYVTTRKTIALTVQTFVSRVVSLLYNTLSKFVIAFLPKSNRLLISWLQSLSTVILEPKKRKSVTASTFSPSICHEVMGPDAMILVSLIFSLKPAFSLSLSARGSLVPLHFLPLEWYHLHIWDCWCFSHLPACNSSSPAFLMMCSAYRLNKQGDSGQPCVFLSQSWTNQLFHTGF